MGKTGTTEQKVGLSLRADAEISQLANTFDQMLSTLEDAYRQTEQALKAQNRFMTDASHELLTWLKTVRVNLALLCREPPITEEDRIAVLNDLNEETDRLIRLVNDLHETIVPDLCLKNMILYKNLVYK